LVPTVESPLAALIVTLAAQSWPDKATTLITPVARQCQSFLFQAKMTVGERSFRIDDIID
jgi:hypothetical protein